MWKLLNAVQTLWSGREKASVLRNADVRLAEASQHRITSGLHPIFALSNPERCEYIKNNIRLSICLHELGHFLIARKHKAPFAAIVLPDLRPDADSDAPVQMPATVVNTTGLSKKAKLAICLAGYAGELCLFDTEYIRANGEHYTSVAASLNDAAAIMIIESQSFHPKAASHSQIEQILVRCLRALQFEPYNTLYRDIHRFRQSATRLYGEWENRGFCSMTVSGDKLG